MKIFQWYFLFANLAGISELAAKTKFDWELQHFYSSYAVQLDHELDCFVPSDAKLIEEYWQNNRTAIKNVLGDIGPTLKTLEEAKHWRNSPKYENADHLIAAATNNAPAFKKKLSDVVNKMPGTRVSFGPNNEHAIKSKRSINYKLDRLRNADIEDPVAKISDVLRGTIVVESPSQMISAVQELKKEFPDSVVFTNKFGDGGMSLNGYVGVHADIHYQNGDDFMMAEVQIHFSEIADGSLQSAKEYSHVIYKKMRGLSCRQAPAEICVKGRLAQMTLFLFGMDKMTRKNNISQTVIKSTGQSSYSSMDIIATEVKKRCEAVVNLLTAIMQNIALKLSS
ncbi:MAG: hypothetical protein V4534_02335 [Myxococcota bacterium]